MKKMNKKMKSIVSNIVEFKKKIEKLPPLSVLERAKLENSIAIEQLYYSSKLEGSNLTHKMISSAIHGQEI